MHRNTNGAFRRPVADGRKAVDEDCGGQRTFAVA
jgi:hypothetical protein